VEELERVRQIAAMEPRNRIDVLIENRKPFAHIAKSERPSVVDLLDRIPIRSHPRLSQRRGIAHRINLEEVLITEPEPNHPGRKLDRITDTRAARARVKIEQVPHQIADQT
jgi:hypothetical protein